MQAAARAMTSVADSPDDIAAANVLADSDLRVDRLQAGDQLPVIN